jgi:predicted dehydrogenase
VFGQQGYANVEGLGGSYGTERLMLGRRRTQGGAPEEEVHEFPGPDESWLREWSAFLDAVDGADSPGADAEDALRTVSCLQQIYDAASSGATSRNISENST